MGVLKSNLFLGRWFNLTIARCAEKSTEFGERIIRECHEENGRNKTTD